MRIQITIAVPDAHAADAGHLAACMGTGPADALTFSPGYAGPMQDGSSNAYRVAAFFASPEWVQGAGHEPARPEWDEDNSVNLTGARRAHDLLTIWAGEGSIPLAEPGRIVAVVGMPPAAALAAMGLSPVPEAGP